MKNSQNKISKISFLLIEEFSMIAFASALEPLRTANRISKKKLFEWEFLSLNNQKVFCSNGISIDTQNLNEEKLQTDILFVCGGINIKDKINKKLLAALRRVSRNGISLGSLCTASYILAKAGLLTNKKATIHWENLSGVREEFPDLVFTNNLYEIDIDRFSCSGGTSSIDLMLNIISGMHGNDLAKNISDQLIHERIRLPNDFQRMNLRSRLGVSHPKLLNAVSIMEENLEEPLSQKELAFKSNISLRQLERLFKKYISKTPNQYYLKLRLERAQNLLMQTSMSILSVALASGFNSSSHFSKCYKVQFGFSPRDTRFQE